MIMKAQDKAKELVETNETSKQKAIREAKSLQGIENNNGWVKIENESDFPKESCDLFIIRNNKIEIANYSFQYKGWFCKGSYYSDNYKNLNITYYQIIQKPKPPLY